MSLASVLEMLVEDWLVVCSLCHIYESINVDMLHRCYLSMREKDIKLCRNHYQLSQLIYMMVKIRCCNNLVFIFQLLCAMFQSWVI